MGIWAIVVTVVINGMDKIMPSLREIMQNVGPCEKIAILVHLSEKPNFEAIKNLPPKEYVEYLKNFCENSQRDILNYLKNSFPGKFCDLNPYWIFNGFYVKAEKEVIEALSQREDVEYIIEDFIIKIEEVIPSEEPGILTPTWNITKVKADSCWNAGYTGQGVIIGHMDTGVDVNHAALSGKWLSPYWYDPVNNQPSPYDDNGHGTHTMGTILGGDGNGPFANDIGVAPGAKFVTCKICNASGSCSSSWIHAGFQKILEWKSQGVQIVAASNSWGSTATTSTEFWQDCLNWRNAGIIPVFAIGNSGPGAGTAGTPGNFPIVIGVGATDSGDNIASFSSRGPAPNQAPWNNTQYWPRPDWNLIKPNISAPGVNVYSSLPNNQYGNMSGTSMATPHVAGAIAILFQKNGALTFTDVYNLLLDYADKPSQGAPYPNNNYGWGRLNVYQSLLHTPTPNMPNITLQSYNLQDAGGNGIWDPGETAYIRVTLYNSGINATNVNATLRTTSQYVTIQDSTSSFGNIPQGQSANNNNDPYIVVAASNTPVGTQVTFDLYITADGGYSNTQSFTVTIGQVGQDWVSHNCGNIVLTVTKWGSIGYLNSSGTGGEGCKYPPTSASHLFYGGFAIGTVMPYVIDRYYEANSVDDDDWKETAMKVMMYEPYPPFTEYSNARYSDSLGEQVKGIICEQRGWAWNDANGDDFVIMEFVLTNSSNQTVSGLYAGLFMDWDIGTYNQNQGGTDATRKMAYLYYGSTYMGSAILNPPRTSNLIKNLSVIDHDVYVYPYSGLPDSVELKFLNGTYSTPSTNRAYDWSTCISAGPFDLAPNQVVKFAVAIAGGADLTALQTHIDTAYARYWGVLAQERPISKPVFLRIYPTISKGEISLSYMLPYNTSAEINVISPSGRIVKEFSYSLEANGNIKKISLNELPKGIYIIKVNTPYKSTKEKVILVK